MIQTHGGLIESNSKNQRAYISKGIISAAEKRSACRNGREKSTFCRSGCGFFCGLLSSGILDNVGMKMKEREGSRILLGMGTEKGLKKNDLPNKDELRIQQTGVVRTTRT